MKDIHALYFNIEDMEKITITGLSKNTTEEKLRDAFFKFGEIQMIKVNNSKGIGFIFYKSDESSSNAAMEMDGEELDGKDLPVVIPTGR